MSVLDVTSHRGPVLVLSTPATGALMHLLTIVSLDVVDHAIPSKTEFHVVVRSGDGEPFRLHGLGNVPFRLYSFSTAQSARSRKWVEQLLAQGGSIKASLESVGPRHRGSDSNYRPSDRITDAKTIIAVTSASGTAPAMTDSLTAPVPGVIMFNAGGKMGEQPVGRAQYRGPK